MSSYEERKKASLGSDYTLYCPTCMIESEVYSAAGHAVDKMNLHCIKCANFVSPLIRNEDYKWVIDFSEYGYNK